MDTNNNAEKDKSGSNFMEMEKFDPQTNSNNVEGRDNPRMSGPPQQQIVPQQTGPPQQMGQQPNGPVWMPPPTLKENFQCPPGLEYFGMLSQLVVKQRIELLEALTGYEQENKYDIFNCWGQYVFKAKEESECCERQCCDSNRSFKMKFLDAYDREVIRFERPLAWMCCNLCCLSVLTVEAPVGVPIGCVRQTPGCAKIMFNVECPIDTHVATIEAPHCCKCFCCTDVPYPILDLNGKQIGEITRHFTVKGYFTDADNFTIEFDPNLSVLLKACLMGALFLVDFMFYEQGNGEGNEGVRGYGGF